MIIKICLVVMCLVNLILWATCYKWVNHPDAILYWEEGTDTDGDSVVAPKMIMNSDLEEILYKGWFTVRVKHVDKGE